MADRPLPIIKSRPLKIGNGLSALLLSLYHAKSTKSTKPSPAYQPISQPRGYKYRGLYTIYRPLRSIDLVASETRLLAPQNSTYRGGKLFYRKRFVQGVKPPNTAIVLGA